MTQPEIIAHQKRLISELRAATAERTQAESRVATQRQEALRGAAARAEAAQAEARNLQQQSQGLAEQVSERTRLPAPAWSPEGGGAEPLAALRESVVRADLAADCIRIARSALEQFYAARHAAQAAATRRARFIAVAAVVATITLAIVAATGIHRAAQARAQARQAQATAEAQARATATAQPAAQATAEAQARAMSQELGLSVPSLAFLGLERNADWIPVRREFDGVLMALAPAGCFMMGSGSTDERPAHQVCFEAPFWIDVYEVTNAQFSSWGGVAQQSSHWTEPQRPRESITWTEAHDFCARRGARLPTEAEWEYAARGPDGLIYPWGNDFVKDHVIYSGNADWRTWDVGSKPGGVSWVGAYDMSGNVWEWVNDRYAGYSYNRSPQVNPQGPGPGWSEYRVLRGGSWLDFTSTLRAASRLRHDPGSWSVNDGFRCALSH